MRLHRKAGSVELMFAATCFRPDSCVITHRHEETVRHMIQSATRGSCKGHDNKYSSTVWQAHTRQSIDLHNSGASIKVLARNPRNVSRWQVDISTIVTHHSARSTALHLPALEDW
jgi:hypothetical protein